MFEPIYEKLIPKFGILDTSWIGKLVSKAAKQRAELLEMMAAAFIKATHIPIKYCELVEEHQSDAIVYYFRDKRTKKEKDNGACETEE